MLPVIIFFYILLISSQLQSFPSNATQQGSALLNVATMNLLQFDIIKNFLHDFSFA